MRHAQKENNMIYIISVGGSLLAPDKINSRFIREFRALLLKAAKKGDKFLIIPGGGATCRYYQNEARKIAKIANDDLDWIGIATNVLHSQFLRAIFGRDASPELITFESKIRDLKKAISVCVGGFQPGGTSDSTAVRFAQKFGAKTVINLTNVAGVYDADPRKFKNAKMIKKMTWQDLKKQFGTANEPGRHMPFDASAASIAFRIGLKVITTDGRGLKNFQNILAGKAFRGTVIQ
jgi:uridylate kinase